MRIRSVVYVGEKIGIREKHGRIRLYDSDSYEMREFCRLQKHFWHCFGN